LLSACFDGSAPQVELVVEWLPCPIQTGGAGDDAECTTINVPIDWDNPSGETIGIFVKRIGPSQGTKQVWMLNGGPGASGAAFEALAQPFEENLPDATLYLMDHRGVGRSQRLGCSAEEENTLSGQLIAMDEWDACLADLDEEWGASLAHFSTTQAARDLGEIINATREEGQEVHIWGGSYGSFWAQRYLSIYPEQPSAVTIKGIVPPDPDGRTYDRDFDQTTRDYLAHCDQDPECARHLGGDVAARTLELYAALDSGHCPEAKSMGLTPRGMRSLFGGWMTWSWYLRALIPPIVYRLERCSLEDLQAIAHLGARLSSGDSEDPNDRLRSAVIGMHISISEIASGPFDIPTALEEAKNTIAGFEFGKRMALLSDKWPRYQPDEYWGDFAETDVPILMIQGALDPATPARYTERVKEHYIAPNQRYVLLPGAGHSFDVPAPSAPRGCPLALWMKFVEDPQSELHGCAEEVPEIRFDGLEAVALHYFGTPSLWDGGPESDEDGKARSTSRGAPLRWYGPKLEADAEL
jgi:pimeloyl-ACP methyl ester carboxylesterase